MKIIYSKKHLAHEPETWQAEHPEVPERAENILHSAEDAGHDIVSPGAYELEAVQTVHSEDYIEYLSNAIAYQAGRYGFDTCTPIMEHTFDAAHSAACCALTGADLLLAGEKHAYALCRPPGHHAGKNYCGGFCYFNNAAIAASRLSENGSNKIAILDIDYHHGNGTQEIFYESDEVLYVSLHAGPHFVFPFRWGFSNETGAGPGTGFNTNFPLAPSTDRQTYLDTLARGLELIAGYGARFMVVSLGVDTYIYDPLGTFELTEDTFSEISARVSELKLPALVVQEGGYNLNHIGRCITNFLSEFN